MLNMIRMELYRMVRMKSFWVIIFIVGFINLVTVALNDMVMETPEYQQAIEASQSIREDDVVANIGMGVSLTPNEDGSYNFLEIICGAAKGMVCALFVGIFTVIFATADFNSGYIKNYGGAVKHRYHMVIAKGIGVMVYTIFFFAVFIASSTVGVLISDHSLVFESGSKIFEVLTVQAFLHIVFGWVIMTLCLIVRNNLVSMIITSCIALHVFAALYSLADKGLKKLGWKKAAISDYTVSGRIMKYGTESKNILASTLVVAAVFIVLSFVLGSLWTTRKDLV